MDKLLYVGIGGFAGAIARYLLSVWLNGLLAPRWGAFPYGTLLVNVVGSFGLALFGVWLAGRSGMPPQLRLLAGAGFFGAFTTFSTFANDSIRLNIEGEPALFILNVILNNGLCLFAVVLGLFVGHRWFAVT